jgi:predicted ATPase
MLARALWLQGFAERARAEAGASIAELSGNRLAICRALSFGMCRVATMTGDFATAEAAIERLTEVAKGVNAPFWQNAGLFLRGKLLVERGNFSEALTALQEAFDTGRRTGWRFSEPEFKGALAEALAGNGQAGEALEAVEDALADAGRQDGQAWYLPELLRIQGEVLLQRGGATATAEDCFARAGEMAREQGALFWELRVALSLARLRVSQHRRNEARQILAPVYDRFTEGFETTDLRAARAMLDPLSL